MDACNIDEVKDIVGFGVGHVLGLEVVDTLTQYVVEAPVEITRSLNTLCEKVARLERLGGIHVSRAGVVALDPDRVGRVIGNTVQQDVLVAIERACAVRAVVKGLSGNRRGEVNQRRIEALKECRGCAQKNTLVRRAGKDLRANILVLGDAEDLAGRAGIQVTGSVLAADFEILRRTKAGKPLSAVPLGRALCMSVVFQE